MKGITISLDEETAAWARVHAAERGMSMSRLVGEVLALHMRETRDYDSAMRRFFANAAVAFKSSGARYPRRACIHDRGRLR